MCRFRAGAEVQGRCRADAEQMQMQTQMQIQMQAQHRCRCRCSGKGADTMEVLRRCGVQRCKVSKTVEVQMCRGPVV